MKEARLTDPEIVEGAKRLAKITDEFLEKHLNILVKNLDEDEAFGVRISVISSLLISMLSKHIKPEGVIEILEIIFKNMKASFEEIQAIYD